jgi:fumarate hydratase class II
MLVTAPTPVIGYDKASATAHAADHTGSTLREAALPSGDNSAEDCDRIVDPRAMIERTEVTT